MNDELTTVQINKGTREVLRKLAGEDLRSMASELEWIVNGEFTRRYSTPQPIQSAIEQVEHAAQKQDWHDARIDERPS